jgi:predicted glutamine amidotransferase
MCELFAMSSRTPTTVRFSLEEFSRRGGLAGPHKDGWGLAYYVEGDVRLLKETLPASDSACVRFVQDHPFASELVLSHIRKATQGTPALRNCQPFVRELGGAMHVFAHNGDLDPLRARRALAHGLHRPVGETDSEHAFCALLERLRDLWLERDAVPPLEERLAVVAGFAKALCALGPANFLYADGDALFAHGHVRKHEGGGIGPPGLHWLCRTCAGDSEAMSAEGLSIAGPGGRQEVALFASVPLTTEAGWQPFDEGELVAARLGRVVARVRR